MTFESHTIAPISEVVDRPPSKHMDGHRRVDTIVSQSGVA